VVLIKTFFLLYQTIVKKGFAFGFTVKNCYSNIGFDFFVLVLALAFLFPPNNASVENFCKGEANFAFLH
jgi:hypothetical protein